jgi:hypothetical protein
MKGDIMNISIKVMIACFAVSFLYGTEDDDVKVTFNQIIKESQVVIDDHSSSVSVVTGHRKRNAIESIQDIDRDSDRDEQASARCICFSRCRLSIKLSNALKKIASCMKFCLP